ncbi:hypothetical protein [Sphingomonas sp. 3-13AW]|uniref:hypothetical protein n=1 Tax=Sphingomonas sp. 3-13AW TaxID=3050450 RepID=UPI003BB68C5B
MSKEEWALGKPTIRSSEYMPVRIVRRGRRSIFVETVSGVEHRYTTRGLWDGFASDDAAVTEINEMRAASTEHVLKMRSQENVIR